MQSNQTGRISLRLTLEQLGIIIEALNLALDRQGYSLDNDQCRERWACILLERRARQKKDVLAKRAVINE